MHHLLRLLSHNDDRSGENLQLGHKQNNGQVDKGRLKKGVLAQRTKLVAGMINVRAQ
jgi:hypothetical protein